MPCPTPLVPVSVINHFMYLSWGNFCSYVGVILKEPTGGPYSPSHKTLISTILILCIKRYSTPLHNVCKDFMRKSYNEFLLEDNLRSEKCFLVFTPKADIFRLLIVLKYSSSLIHLPSTIMQSSSRKWTLIGFSDILKKKYSRAQMIEHGTGPMTPTFFKFLGSLNHNNFFLCPYSFWDMNKALFNLVSHHSSFPQI